jgi:hypothetical protein
MFFELKNAPGRVLSAPDQEEESELVLKWMTAELSNANMWKFEVQAYTVLEWQHWEEWCWAAAARMLVNHYYNVPESHTQTEAVKAVMGNPGNYGGNLADSIEASNYYRSTNTSNNLLNLVSHDHGRYSEENLRRFINDGHVLWIARGKYSTVKGLEEGHATVVVGYTSSYTNGTIQYNYIIFDPWPPEKYKIDEWSSPVTTDENHAGISGQIFV